MQSQESPATSDPSDNPSTESTVSYSVIFSTNLPDTYSEDGLVLTGYEREIKVKEGKTVSEPKPILTYQGTEIPFDGWKTSNGEYFDFSQPINNNINIYGTWKSTEVNGTWYIFDLDGLIDWNKATMTDLSASMVLFSDIQLDNTNTSWTPVGNGESYHGTIEGKNHTISGIKVISEDEYLGFVGILNGGLISNLNLDNVTIVAIEGGEFEGSFDFSCIGSYAGWFIYGTISDCSARGTISNELESGITGGLVGENSEQTIINNSSFSGKISAQSMAGGIIGQNRGKIGSSNSDVTISTTFGAGGIASANYGDITSCFSKGTIGSSDTAYSGGIAANNYGGSIFFSDSSALVCGNNPVGGISGANTDSKGIIAGCSFSGNISSAFGEVGGIVARNEADIIASYSTGNIISSASYSNYYLGGITGTNEGNIYACYSTSDIVGAGQIGGIAGSNSGSIGYCLWQNEANGIKNDNGLSTNVAIASDNWKTEYPILNIGIEIWNSRYPSKQCNAIYTMDSSIDYPIIKN